VLVIIGEQRGLRLTGYLFDWIAKYVGDFWW